MKWALSERGGMDVGYIFTVSKSKEESYREDAGSLIVRVDVDEHGEIKVLNVLENEPGMEAKVRKAFAGLSIPKDTMAPGHYDLQIGLTDAEQPNS
jgi:hypothetical protein